MSDHKTLKSSESSILIVDDNPQNLQVLGKLLQENRYEIEFAISGEAALIWMGKRKFDLILLDINMPGMDGFEVCRKIRTNPEMNNIPVIFLSAVSERESILHGFDLGAQDYVTKPFDSRELLVRVRTHLALKESMENLADINELLEEKVLERTHLLNEANEKLEAMNMRLIDLDKAKSDFLNLISHEIRTPLNGINGILELLKMPADTSEIDTLVEMLDVSVKRLERFSLDALLITRLKTKQLEIIKETIPQLNLINEVLKEEKDILESKNIQVKIKDETNNGLIFCEASLIKKCIGNILGNAIRFSPEGGVIDINTFIQNQHIICEIKDQGKGFVQGVDHHVFRLFNRDPDYKDNSMGIGLPIAGMIMEAHGGSIIIGNNQAGGASVKLLFKNNNAV